MLLAYLLREAGPGSAPTRTRAPQGSSSSPQPASSEASTNLHPAKPARGCGASPALPGAPMGGAGGASPCPAEQGVVTECAKGCLACRAGKCLQELRQGCPHGCTQVLLHLKRARATKPCPVTLGPLLRASELEPGSDTHPFRAGPVNGKHRLASDRGRRLPAASQEGVV